MSYFHEQEDILYHIFLYLLLPTVQFRLTLVNKLWYHVINREQFVEVYKMNVNLNEYCNPKISNMKNVFDWSEMIIDKYPLVYESLQQLKRSILSVERVPPIRMQLETCKITLQLQDKKISLYSFTETNVQQISFLTYVDQNKRIVDDSQVKCSDVTLIQSTLQNHYVYHHMDDMEELRSAKNMDHLCVEFSQFLTHVPPGVFWGMLEALTHLGKQSITGVFPPGFKGICYALYNNTLAVRYVHQVYEYLRDTNYLFAQAMQRGNRYLFDRQMKNGQMLTVSDMKEILRLRSHSAQGYPIDTISLVIQYCEYHKLESRELIQPYLGEIFIAANLGVCKSLIRNKIVVPKRFYYALSRDGSTKYDILDYLHEAVTGFYCPFDLRTPVLHQSAMDSGTVLVAFCNKLSKRAMEETYSKYELTQSAERFEYFVFTDQKAITVKRLVTIVNQKQVKLILLSVCLSFGVNSALSLLRTRMESIRHHLQTPISLVFDAPMPDVHQNMVRMFPDQSHEKMMYCTRENLEQYFANLYGTGQL